MIEGEDWNHGEGIVCRTMFSCIGQVFPDTIVLWEQKGTLFDEFFAWFIQALAGRVADLKLHQVHPEVMSLTTVLAAVPLLFFIDVASWSAIFSSMLGG